MAEELDCDRNWERKQVKVCRELAQGYLLSHESKDGELVVIHESDLSRTTNGMGRVSDLTLAQLKQLDAGVSFSAEFAGQRIPTLSQVLELAQGKILLNVEIKVTDELFTEKVLALIHKWEMRDQVILSSFDPSALKHSRKIDPGMRTASLYNEVLHAGKSPVQILEEVGSAALNLRHDQVTANMVAKCHEHGRPVAVYTVNQPVQMQALIDLEVDALFTDRLDVMIGLVR
jgi:glycerophosphoryl diester phosphodiesterase